MIIGIVIIWFASFDGIGILFLILFALIALGFKDIVIDILAFIYIMARHPFAIQDYIKVESNMGQVVDIDLLQFHMEEYGGNLTMITPMGKFITYPNRIIFQMPIINYSHDHDLVKMEESIVIAFNQDTDQAIQILESIAAEAYERTFADIDEQRTFFFNRYLKEHGASLEPFVWVDREDVGYRLHIIYSTPISKIARNQRFIQVAMQKDLSQAGYEIVIPQALKLMDQ